MMIQQHNNTFYNIALQHYNINYNIIMLQHYGQMDAHVAHLCKSVQNRRLFAQSFTHCA